MDSPFNRFTDAEVREMLRGAGMSDELNDTTARRLGLVRIQTQRQQVLSAYQTNPSVDAIFDALRKSVPKSSIRAYLCRAYPNGEWRSRRPRGSRLASLKEASA